MKKKISAFLILTLFVGGTEILMSGEQSSVVKSKYKKMNKMKKKKSSINISKPVTSEVAPVGNTVNDQSKKSGMSSWLMELKNKIARNKAKNNKIVAVGAVRGAEIEDAPPLYWKGKTSESVVSQNEMDDFEKAVDMSIQGDGSAKLLFENFITKYPQSSLVADANEAILKINQP
ncbi:MAG: hypothetical protein ACKVQC_10490 [Elusimicrobiota bacterium]